MHRMVLLFALLSPPAFAADYTPWQESPAGRPALGLLELAQQRDTCCKHCKKGKPCGNTCIATTSKCKQPPGCAC